MPELHKNQVAWAAPEPQKVSLAKPDYSYLANAMDSLSRDSQYIADAERKRLDDAMAADLTEQLNLANQDIEDARSDTADFDSLSEKALSRLQGAFNQYDGATRRRFMESNPHYFDNVQLAITEKIQKHQRQVIETGVENDLPLWTSQAVMEGTPQARQNVITKIQERLGNISTEATVDNMIFKANTYMDKATVSNLLVMGTEDSLRQAEAFLKTPEVSETLDPLERSNYLSMIKNKREQLLKEKEAKQKAGEDPESQMILNIYSEYRMQGMTAPADQLFDDVRSNKQCIEMVPDSWGVKVNGKPIPQCINLDHLSPVQRAGLLSKMKEKDSLDPNKLVDEAKYANAVTDAITNYQIDSKNGSVKTSSSIMLIDDLIKSPAFKSLTDKDRNRLVEIRDDYLNAVAETIESAAPQWENKWGFAGQKISSPIGQAAALLNRTPTQKILDTLGGLKTSSAYEPISEMSLSTEAKNAATARKVGSWTLSDRSDTDRLFGQYIVDFSNKYVQRFAKDTDYNSTSRFGINVIGTLRAYQEAGKLAGTRLDASSKRLASALTKWESVAYASGMGKETINKENEKYTDALLSLIINDEATADEKKLFNDIVRQTRTIHGSYDTNDQVLRSFSEISPTSTYEPGTSVLHPVADQMNFGNALWAEKNKAVETAYKKATKK